VHSQKMLICVENIFFSNLDNSRTLAGATAKLDLGYPIFRVTPRMDTCGAIDNLDTSHSVAKIDTYMATRSPIDLGYSDIIHNQYAGGGEEAISKHCVFAAMWTYPSRAVESSSLHIFKPKYETDSFKCYTTSVLKHGSHALGFCISTCRHQQQRGSDWVLVLFFSERREVRFVKFCSKSKPSYVNVLFASSS